MERRFPGLRRFLTCYLNEDWPIFYGTPERAVEQAIEEYPLDFRKQVRQELAAFLSETSDDKNLRDMLNDGLGVNLHFKRPADARVFAESVEAKLMKSIRAHFNKVRGSLS